MSGTLLLTIVAALGVGIGAGYAAVMAVLLPFRRNAKPAPRAAVLAPGTEN
jgi:hypothetical protein